MIRLVFILVTAAYAAKFRRLDDVRMTDSLYNVTMYDVSDITTSTADRCLMKCPDENCMGISWNTLDQSCLLMHALSTPTYKGMNFTKDEGWITYYRVETYSANKMAASSSDCPSSWIHNSELGSCYYFIITSGSYDEVLSQCQSLKPGYSKLVMIDNDNEKDYLLNLTTTNDRYWIGLRRSLDMTWFSNPSQNSWPMLYQNWRDSEPNQIREECAHLDYDDGEWNDWSCHMSALGICEIDVESGDAPDKLYYR